MKFSLSWLRRHLETTATAEDLSTALTRLGLEVESLYDAAAALKDFVVAHIEAAEAHPNADRLRVCRVHDGTSVHQVVCGAPNARAGLKVILARPGVVIPSTGSVLQRTTIRGIESCGMLCSSRELCLSEEADGIAELAADIPLGLSVAEIYGDQIFDLSITPNRADCFGVRGIARDLAAAGLGVLRPLPADSLSPSYDFPYKISYGDDDAQRYCPFFCAVEIRGVRNGSSPPWLQDLLKKAGQNPISALVDVTNFFALDRCRPLHCYDVRAFVGTPVVRSAHQDESFRDLKGKTHTLHSFMSVLADETGPLGLLGVMGGERSASTLETSTILLEAAWFAPEAITRTGQALCLTTEARTRFERGVDYATTIADLKAAAAMIVEFCGGEVSEVLRLGAPPALPPAITLPLDLFEKRVGVSIEKAEIVRLLQALGCTETAPHIFQPPSWRPDLTLPENLCGEILRLYGFDKVEVRSLPNYPKSYAKEMPAYTLDTFKRQLAGRGMIELVSFPFLRSAWAQLFQRPEAQSIELLNPISSELSVLCTSLLPHLLEAVAKNSRRETAPFAFFEAGPVFDRQFESYERPMIAGVRSGILAAYHWGKRSRPVDVFDAKADLEALFGMRVAAFELRQGAPSWFHPGCSGTFFDGETPVGVFGLLHPEVLATFDIENMPVVGFEVYLDALKEAPLKEVGFVAYNLPSVARDFAFVVDKNLLAARLVACVRHAGGPLVSRLDVFDVYSGSPLTDDKKSVGISVIFQPQTATLSEEEVQTFSHKIVHAVSEQLGGTLR
ncbi:MAG: phenylalanine--tRNA ligase subunit beta [Holosporales bacterium]|jgi:phenylalanyl-tRNA synthetase beta chain|nr:phenylalanine--tRNA ligase subunit beta [Holosporales bacterium]